MPHIALPKTHTGCSCFGLRLRVVTFAKRVGNLTPWTCASVAGYVMSMDMNDTPASTAVAVNAADVTSAAQPGVPQPQSEELVTSELLLVEISHASN